MKLAFVLDAFSMGGIETVACSYVDLLNKAGHEIDLYILNKHKTDMKDMLPSGVNFHALSFDRKICPELYSYGVMKWWWGKYAYCIIHPILTIGIKIRKLFWKKKKFDAVIAFTGHINDLTFVAEDFLKTKQKICWCHGTLLSYLAICDGYPKLYKKFDKIVTLSEQGLTNTFLGHAFLKQKIIKNIYNPVPIRNKPINYEHVKKLQDKFGDYILMIARAVYPKDHKTVINAVARIHEMGLHKHVVFVGDGEQLEEFKKYAAQVGLELYCHFEGTRRDVCDYIAASYIDVLASNSEGLPTVIPEAMAFGKPCIMTNSDGGEVSGYGKYCRLTNIGDFNEMATDLFTLYTNLEEYNKYSKLAEERYKDFEPIAVLEKFVALLSEE